MRPCPFFSLFFLFSVSHDAIVPFVQRVLNLFQDRRYFKQQEIILWRKLQAQTPNMRAIDATKKL
jgi:hypothetical protein